MSLAEKELLELSKEIASANRMLAGTCHESIGMAKDYREHQIALSRICLDIYRHWLQSPSLTEAEEKWCKRIFEAISYSGMPMRE